MLKVLGIIPARGGSKGIPKKNIYPVKGLPLIAYTLRAAEKSKLLSACIVSSDNPKIIAAAKKYGGKAPFVRPSALATDKASSLDVVLHGLRFMESQGFLYDAVMLLQPTCPLRSSADIDAAIRMLERNPSADSVVSVCRLEEPHPVKTLQIVKRKLKPFLAGRWKENLRRQDLPETYFLNGAVYCVRKSTLLKKPSLWGKTTLPYVMPQERSVNIDEILDVRWMEFLLSR
ncbi:MAG: acylneuraminate cytidylyltransferase family protein [Candidatus Omnitrophica bacterium]|nr:acylneuraminate cytidylyltransferase family protein [Candidatus Omnitrophota bacterium]